MLRRVVEEGSGRPRTSPATALPEDRHRREARPEGATPIALRRSFVGFAPATQPRLVVLVTVDEPRGAIWGGTVAAPAFAEIAEFVLPVPRGAAGPAPGVRR